MQTRLMTGLESNSLARALIQSRGNGLHQFPWPGSRRALSASAARSRISEKNAGD